METQEKTTTRLTILLPAGRLPHEVMAKVNELAHKYNLEVYLSTAQNLRLMGIREEDLGRIRNELQPLGVDFKGPGKFPLPRVCIGNRDCNLGIADPHRLSLKILEHFKAHTKVKPKFKIAISGCPASCSGAGLTDIGIMATRSGFDIYVGGKMGPVPKTGRRIVRGADEDKVIAVIEELVNFHDARTDKKNRMSKLIDDPDFPYKA